MDMTTVFLLLAGVAVAALIAGRISHKLWPGALTTVSNEARSLEAKVVTEAHDLRVQAEADAINALTRVVAWATDKSAEQAAIAAANAVMARKDAMRAHAASVLSAPPASPAP